MTNFSTNQVMQFYVASGALVPTAIPGRGIVLDIDGKKTDIIENVLWGKLTTADALATPCKEVTVTVTADKVIGGENYIVRVSYPDVFGAGKESWATKTAVAQLKAGVAVSEIVETIKKQLEESLPEFITVGVTGKNLTFTANPDTAGYKRGFRPVVMPDFEVSVNTVVDEGEDVQWAEIKVGKAASTISGVYKLADMEYFALGERGDEYRQMGWPAVNYDADYKVDTNEAYDVLVVHYAYAGSNDQSHLSEKDLIIAAPTAEGGNANLLTIVEALEPLGGKFTKVSGTSGDKESDL
jgi:hypothetical protein